MIDDAWRADDGLTTLLTSDVAYVDAVLEGFYGLPRESALAFSLVGAGLMVVLSLSGAVAWLARRHPEPAPTAGS